MLFLLSYQSNSCSIISSQPGGLPWEAFPDSLSLSWVIVFVTQLVTFYFHCNFMVSHYIYKLWQGKSLVCLRYFWIPKPANACWTTVTEMYWEQYVPDAVLRIPSPFILKTSQWSWLFYYLLILQMRNWRHWESECFSPSHPHGLSKCWSQDLNPNNVTGQLLCTLVDQCFLTFFFFFFGDSEGEGFN